MFGIPCYLANSAIAEVGYRGDIVKDAATQQMRVVVGQLLLLVKSYPVKLNGLPIGASWYRQPRRQVHVSQDHPEDYWWRLSLHEHSR